MKGFIDEPKANVKDVYDKTQAVAKADIVNDLTNGSTNPVSSGGVYNAVVATASQTVYGTYCYCFKKAGIVYVYGHSAGGLSLTGDADWHSLTTLPEGYRPPDDIWFAGANASGKSISFHIAASGLVEYVCGTGNTTSYWNYGTSFVCA